MECKPSHDWWGNAETHAKQEERRKRDQTRIDTRALMVEELAENAYAAYGNSRFRFKYLHDHDKEKHLKVASDGYEGLITARAMIIVGADKGWNERDWNKLLPHAKANYRDIAEEQMQFHWLNENRPKCPSCGSMLGKRALEPETLNTTCKACGADW